MRENQQLRAKALLKKYLEGNCTEQEKAWVEEWYLTLQEDVQEIQDEEAITDLSVLKDRLAEIPKRKIVPITYIRSIAAAVLLLLTVGVLWTKKVTDNSQIVDVSHVQDILPGSNKATLTLEGEEGIELSGQQDGLITDGTAIMYPDGTTIKQVENVKMATLSTPIAGQYQLTLPDGTKAWLNAQSSIRYPTTFIGAERLVSVTGEVYFEVARNTKQPFIVRSDRQEIKVLGTSFNINAYGDDGQVLTTLTEGSLQVNAIDTEHRVILIPGQQAIVSDAKSIIVKKVDIEEVSSWKEGLYIINDEQLNHYAKKIERWYDVEIDMKKHGNKHLSAIIPRDAKLSEVLQAITLKTGVEFKVEGRRVAAEE